MDFESFKRQWKDDSDYIVAHTSGSTGTPKEIKLPKADMLVSALATCRRFGITSSSTLHLPLSFDYIAGKMMAVRALVSGARLIVETPSLTPLNQQIDSDIDLTAIVPSQIEGLLKSPGLNRVKNIIVGGAPMNAEQETLIKEITAECYATYGMTETCSHVALRNISVDQREFEAMPGVSFSADSRGCLVITAPEYSFKQLTTNDVVDIIDERRFIWRGRFDTVINSGGIKIFPEEVEAMLKPIVGDVDFMITSRPSEKWGEEVIMKVAGNVDSATILQRAKEILPKGAVPKEIIAVEHIPHTESGKIKRR